MTWSRTRATHALCLKLALLGLVFLPQISVAQSRSDERSVSANDFGGIGLIQTRSARFGSDGSFEVGTTFINPYRRWYFRLTLLPWFEGTFRYTDIRNRLYSNDPSFSGGQTFKDRGADIKFRLWPESRYIPQIAVGMQDGLGTGIFRGEYLVVSKRWHDLDFSGGIGWGYLGSGGTVKNPLLFLSDTLKSRSSTAGTGGAPLFGSWFSGEFVAPFFGVEYQTPIVGLTLKAEYAYNDYKNEPQSNVLEASSRWNFGLNYRPFSWLDLSLAFERGNTYMSRLALLADLHDPGLPKFDAPPPPIKIRAKTKNSASVASGASGDNDQSDASWLIAAQSNTSRTPDNDRAVEKLFANFEKAGLEVTQFELTHDEARIHLVHGLGQASINKAEQFAGMIAELIPSPVERVTFLDSREGTLTAPLVVSRNDIERNAIVDYLFDRLEPEGFHFRSLDLTHKTATLTLSPDPGSARLTREMEVRTAEAVLRASPTPLEHVTIISATDKFVHGRTTLHRDEVDRDAAIGNLFDITEADGVRIESLSVSHEKATAYVTAHDIKRPDEYVNTAYKIAYGVPLELEEVKIVDLARDTELIVVTLKRGEDGWNTVATTSGASGPDNPLRSQVSHADKTEIANQLFTALAEQDLLAEGVQIGERSAKIYVASRKFRQFARNVGLVARVAANMLPDRIEEFTIVHLSAGAEMNRVTVWREDLERVQLARGSSDEIWSRTKIQPPQAGSPQAMIRNPDRYPLFNWKIAPAMRQHIGGPSKLLLYQFWARITANLDLMPGLSFRASYGHDIYNNFGRIRLVSDSVLDHVRSDIKEYLQQGEDALVVLQGDYIFSPANDFYARLSAGLFEEMYGGVSSEVLYRPFNSRLAIGADLSWVRQREFDVKLKFRDYSTRTGHFNIYYEWPWHQLLTSVHIGEYLARDRGGTFITSRVFDSGVRMGAWVTLTNVPFEEFGEGSFDKGIFLTIPLELFLMKSGPSYARFGFRPLTRDGGQTLDVSTRLYDLTFDANLGRVADHWDRFLN